MAIGQIKRHSYEIVYNEDGHRYITSENYIDISACLEAFNNINKLNDKTLIEIQERIMETISIPITK